MTALAKSPRDRYASAKELAADLNRFLNDQAIKARPEGALRWLWRRSRRHATSLLLGLSVVLTSTALLIVLLILNKPSAEEREHKIQQEALTALTRDLDLKKKVTLIGDCGLPDYFRWRTDEKPGKMLAAPDGAFSVQNWEYGLVELLPDPRLERYRFGAEVRHERQAHQESRVGIYFAHSAHPDGETVAHFYCNVAFNDLVDVGANGIPKGNSVGLGVLRQSPTGLVVHHKAYVYKADTRFVPAKPIGALGPWRRIAVEVRPGSLTVFWEGNRIATTTRATLMMSARPLIPRPNQALPNNPPRFAPRDGLGLYVSLGVASFRNVVVESLGNEN